MIGITKLAKHFLPVCCIIGIKLPVKVAAEESSILDGATVLDSMSGLSDTRHPFYGSITSAFGVYTMNSLNRSPTEIKI